MVFRGPKLFIAVVALSAAAATAAGIYAAQAGGRQRPRPKQHRISMTVAQGVTPRMAEAEVRKLVLPELGQYGRIDSMNVVADLAAAAKGAPTAVPETPADAAAGPIWIVRGFGDYKATYLPPGSNTTDTYTGTGYYLVNDQTGQIMGMGWP